eukprot:TRINITY_DN5211_c0_g1_i1.p1 TRINITY_DN5211_c0_g1~~TRINITY_DN5211_c0_g1_i1.p1  ORF type:complete len:493 (+),score=81.81 TRINITY_DN5211_c0_g1_i1:62-1540(+)
MHKFSFYFLIPSILLLSSLAQTERLDHDSFSSSRRVAIIGAGISGSASAYFLREKQQDAVEIVLYEKSAKSCGRVTDIDFQGHKMEVGASIYHISNRYVRNFVRKLGLQEYSMGQSPNSSQHLAGIWDGRQFRFTTSRWGLLTKARGFFRYGFSSVYLRTEIENMLRKFLSLYPILDSGRAFSSVRDLLSAADIFDRTQITLDQLLMDELNLNPMYVDEIVTGITRVNYAQNTTINSLVGLIALITDDDDELMSVRGGNRQICDGILRESQALLRLNTTVEEIEAVETKSGSTKYQITAKILKENGETDLISEEYDAVIVASPFEQSQVKFGEKLAARLGYRPGQSASPLVHRPYAKCHVTLIRGILDNNYFNFPEDGDLPQHLLTTDNDDIPFRSLNAWKDLEDGTKIFKIFSEEVIDDDLIKKLFTTVKDTYRTMFYAYPMLQPMEFPPVKIEENLVYTNALEFAFSCMETQVMSARHVVNLIYESFSRR